MPWRGDPVPPDRLAEAATRDPGRPHSAEAYWDRLRPHLAEFGISRVADITGLDRIGVPVLQAVRPRARSNAVTQGKATTPAGAAVGAVLECLEMAAGEDLAHLQPAAPDPNPLWSGLAPGAHWPNGDTPFVAAWDLAQVKPAAVPRAVLSSDFTPEAEASAAPILRHSIGLGAGATLAAALFHGLLECIEADARLRAEASGRARRLRLPSDDPVYGALVRRLTGAGLRIRAEDITARPGPRVVAASIMEAPRRHVPAASRDGVRGPLRPCRGCRRSADGSGAGPACGHLWRARGTSRNASTGMGMDPDLLATEWDRHGPGPAMAVPSDPWRADTVRMLAQGLGPVHAVPLVWRPELPLAVTRVVAPALLADPQRLQPAS